MKQIKLQITTILLLLIVLSFSGFSQNYLLLTKGQRCPYDTAVAIKIDTYRTETLKMETADSVIFRKSLEIAELRQFVLKSNKLFATQAEMYAQAITHIEIKDNTILELSNNFDNLMKTCNTKENWFKRNKLAVGFFTGFIATFITFKTIK